jgi:hypothetical protein
VKQAMGSQLDERRPVLLAVPMWMTWTIRPGQDGDANPPTNNAVPIAMVSWARLQELGPRLSIGTSRSGPHVHELVRFNLYNFGEQSITVCRLCLRSIRGESFECDITPPVAVSAGERYPFLAEVRFGPVAETVQVEVDVHDRRAWVTAQRLVES